MTTPSTPAIGGNAAGSFSRPNAEQPALRPLPRFLRRLIEVNYCYVVSALLVMIGCYLLMHSQLIEGRFFAHTVKTLMILQIYELAVILTAAAIVRRFGILDDAATLLMIELALLLDPTFFSNSFATMMTPEATMVNLVCLLLAPLKLAVLEHALHLRISPRTWAAFLLAVAGREAALRLSPAAVLLGIGIALFAGGWLVTFNKRRLLLACDAWGRTEEKGVAGSETDVGVENGTARDLRIDDDEREN
jgi:hypothetical protein